MAVEPLERSPAACMDMIGIAALDLSMGQDSPSAGLHPALDAKS